MIVKNAIQLLDNKEVDSFIEWELLTTLDLYTFLMLKLGIYNEIEDKIMLSQACKVKFSYNPIEKNLSFLISGYIILLRRFDSFY